MVLAHVDLLLVLLKALHEKALVVGARVLLHLLLLGGVVLIHRSSLHLLGSGLLLHGLAVATSWAHNAVDCSVGDGGTGTHGHAGGESTTETAHHTTTAGLRWVGLLWCRLGSLGSGGGSCGWGRRSGGTAAAP